MITQKKLIKPAELPAQKKKKPQSQSQQYKYLNVVLQKTQEICETLNRIIKHSKIS